jgi:hypothetical protein
MDDYALVLPVSIGMRNRYNEKNMEEK